jgi:pyrimidine operon attenuation protein/uracil phosphoribosyltransferase
MTDANANPRENTVVLDAAAVGDCVHRLAQEIVNENEDLATVALLGVLKRGRPLADRIAAAIGSMTGARVQIGSLSTRLYRDDLRSGRAGGFTGGAGTHFDFDVDGLNLVIVDDVLSTGRTCRAALDEIMDYGRPRRIQLACLVDRGCRELPIQADFLGWSLATHPDDHVRVRLQETDGEDAVLLERAGTPEPEGA